MTGQPQSLENRIRSGQAGVAVVGLGYVGLPLAVEFASGGFRVTGIDVDATRVEGVNRGISHVPDVADTDLEPLIRDGRLRATTGYDDLGGCDVILICVPTPLRKTRDPDISYILTAVDAVAASLRRGQLVVLESTTYPGTTEELFQPRLEARRLKVGVDFFLAFSPERVDPGNREWTTRNTPKIVGGVTAACGAMARLLYEQVLDRVVPVSSARTAEMVKLLENTFRSVNIGLVNEIALICDRLGIGVWEVIEAAATKPFGFLPFFPGPGLGGHCIPVDPHYLSWKLKTLNYTARFIDLAATINASMPGYVVDKVVQSLNDQKKSVNGSRILTLGVAYKKNVGDTRESPALDIMQPLRARGAEVVYHDPHVARLELPSDPEGRRLLLLASSELTEDFMKTIDCTVIVTDHDCFDYPWIVERSRAVVDTRNATRAITRGRDKIRMI